MLIPKSQAPRFELVASSLISARIDSCCAHAATVELCCCDLSPPGRRQHHLSFYPLTRRVPAASPNVRTAIAVKLLANAAIGAPRVGSNFGAQPCRWNAVFSVALEQALGPPGKGLCR